MATIAGCLPHKIADHHWQKLFTFLQEHPRAYAGQGGRCRRFVEAVHWILLNRRLQRRPRQRPFVNIRFGADYLRWVQDLCIEAYENPVAALAGYNAGPGNARTWFDRSAPDEALFIERIPYSETRLNLQRILTHYAHYLRIYGSL